MLYQLGDTKVQVEEGVWVAENAVVVGNVLLKENSSVWFNAVIRGDNDLITIGEGCLLYTSPSPRDRSVSRMPSSA